MSQQHTKQKSKKINCIRLLSSITFTGSMFLFATSAFAATTTATGTPTTSTPAAISATSNGGLTVASLSVDDKEDFVVEPGKMEVYLDPGQSVTKYISITSRIKSKTAFSVTAEDFIGSQSQSNPVVLLGNGTSPYSLKDWLAPAVGSLSLNFGDRVTLPVVITAPKNASPGGYYAAVIISNEPQVDQNAADASTPPTTRLVSRIGMLFFVRVNGPVNSSGSVSDFKINNPQFIYQKPPLDFQILFNNNGTIYLAPYGQIHITNFIGTDIADLPVDAYFSMPDSLRYRDVIWDDSAVRIGRYTATLELNRGYGNLVDTKVITFWIIPWAILGYTLLGLVIIIGILYFLLSRFEFRRKK